MQVPTGPDTAQGGHRLPLHLVGSSRTTRPPRARITRTPVLIALGAAVVLIGVGSTQLITNLTYDDARAEFTAASDAADRTEAEVRDELSTLEAAKDAAVQIRAGDTGILTDGGSAAALDGAIAEADALSSDAADRLAQELPAVADKPMMFWELIGATTQLRDDTRSIDTISADISHLSPTIVDADETITTAGLAYLIAAADSAGPFESGHISAKNDDVIALRAAASVVAASVTLDQSAADAFVALQSAAAGVAASAQTELSEKAGPLLDTRLAIEDFARSLAPGVLLEFDWNTIVNGAGLNGSMGGLTTWWWDDPDRAVIELSNSVAEQWPADRSKALVAHEVGHAISVKCEDMYDSSTQESIESWATAWAISMGFTDDANGVWAYGYPAQSYIDAAAGCR